MKSTINVYDHQVRVEHPRRIPNTYTNTTIINALDLQMFTLTNGYEGAEVVDHRTENRPHGACSNCGQWTRKSRGKSYADCSSACYARGLAD